MEHPVSRALGEAHSVLPSAAQAVDQQLGGQGRPVGYGFCRWQDQLPLCVPDLGPMDHQDKQGMFTLQPRPRPWQPAPKLGHAVFESFLSRSVF